jgi:Zincin-like metallopeptidase
MSLKNPNKPSRADSKQALVLAMLQRKQGGDHCHHHEGNRLATSLGPWLPNEGGAQKTRPREAFSGTATSTPPRPFTSSPIYEPTDGCDRKPGKRFGDEAYAMEELVAELGAAFLCADLGITSEPRADHAQYLDLWHNALRRWGH